MSGRSGTTTCALGANPWAIKRGRRLPYCLLLIALLLGAAILQKDGRAGFTVAPTRSNAQWANLYAALPLSFEANRGQTAPSVSFLSRGRGFALFLANDEAVLTLNNSSSALSGRKAAASTSALRMKLLGANAHAAVTGFEELPGKANYLIGNDRSKWRTNVPTYARVRYQGVYPGVDLVYYGTMGGELEYDFVVAPGADPKSIALGIETQGNSPLHINSQGDLIVTLPSGDVQLHKPVVYQSVKSTAQNGTRKLGNRQSTFDNRQLVKGNFVLDAQNHVRFELGPYDHNRALVIDPLLNYATYLGGTGGDIGYAIAVDSNFDAYIAGITSSSDFPQRSPEQTAGYKGNGDAFVTKLNSTGTALIYSTYVGGSQADSAQAIAVSNGSVFITGWTDSDDFPVQAPTTTANPFQMTYGGNTDAFVTQLDTSGENIVYSTYLGGNGYDVGQGIAADSVGYAYVTGYTQSANFPTTTNALQSIIHGSEDAFVTKVNLTGEALLFSTFLGGAQADIGQAIQVDTSGDMYVAGYTFSADFPLAAPLQSTNGGGADAFITEIKGDFSKLVFSTYLGGSGDDRAMGIGLDGTSNVYVAGTTASANFPFTSGVFQTELKGPTDAFVSKLNPTGSSLVYSTYLGGSNAEQANAIAVTSGGIAFVTGLTKSDDFPTQNPVQSLLGLSSSISYCGGDPCPDAFVTQLNATGTALVYSTYLGGNGYDSGQSIAVDSTGAPYVTGSTQSANFPAVYAGAYQSAEVGTAGNAFVAKIGSSNTPQISIVPDKLNFGNEAVSVTSALQQITIVNPSTAPLTIATISVGEVGTSYTVFQESDNCIGTLPGGGAFCTMYVSFTPASTGSVNDEITLTDDAGGVAIGSSGGVVTGAQQTISLSGFGNTANTAVTLNPSSLSFTSQNVGSVSAPQNVTITNTGTQTLDITSINLGTSTDFAETDNSCLALNFTLNINQSCTVSVTFQPKATGTRTALLAISDNAVGSPQTVSLTGIGAAEFSLQELATNTGTVNPALIGDTQTTFVLDALGPDSFKSNTISLSCSAGTTCTFNPTTLVVGAQTTMTVSNLTTSMANPYIFTVTGTSGSQTNTLQINLDFEDFTLTASPSIDTISAGSIANYNIIVNPLFGFNQKVQLSCYQGLPPDAICSFTPSATPTPTGSGPTNVTLSISTQKYTPTTTHTLPWLPKLPKGPIPPIIFGLLSLAGLASLALGNRRGSRRTWVGVRLAAVSLILALNLGLAACRSSTLLISGTTTGNYTITISGTLLANTAVLRTTTTALAVTSTPTP